MITLNCTVEELAESIFTGAFALEFVSDDTKFQDSADVFTKLWKASTISAIVTSINQHRRLDV